MVPLLRKRYESESTPIPLTPSTPPSGGLRHPASWPPRTRLGSYSSAPSGSALGCTRPRCTRIFRARPRCAWRRRARARTPTSRCPSETPSPCCPTARISSPSTGGFRARAWSWTAAATRIGPVVRVMHEAFRVVSPGQDHLQRLVGKLRRDARAHGQPTIRLDHMSITSARYSQPCLVFMQAMSANHAMLGLSALDLRLARSSADSRIACALGGRFLHA